MGNITVSRSGKAREIWHQLKESLNSTAKSGKFIFNLFFHLQQGSNQRCFVVVVFWGGGWGGGWALPPKGFSCLVSENQFVFSELSGLSRWVTTLAMLFKRL